MTRINLLVEGATELNFVKRVIAPYLASFDVYVVPRRVMTSRDRRAGKIYRGGLSKYRKFKDDLDRWMKEDKDKSAIFSTMIDYYGLPKDFPGYKSCTKKPDPYEAVSCLEGELGKDIGSDRFMPYIQLHEFETLLLSDVSKFEQYFVGEKQAVAKLAKMVSAFDSPEQINHDSEYAPSKRIIREFPSYQGAKSTAATIIAEKIGIETMLEKCPHFKTWIEILKSERS